jgi:hypothetical protein
MGYFPKISRRTCSSFFILSKSESDGLFSKNPEKPTETQKHEIGFYGLFLSEGERR